MPMILSLRKDGREIGRGLACRSFLRLKDGTEVGLSHPSECFQIYDFKKRGLARKNARTTLRSLGFRKGTLEVGHFPHGERGVVTVMRPKEMEEHGVEAIPVGMS